MGKSFTKILESKIGFKLVSLWIYFDVKLHLKGIEDQLRRGNLVISDEYKPDKYKYVINHVQYLINNIYIKPDFFVKELESIHDEAVFVCDLFTEAYTKGVNNHDHDLVVNFFPKKRVDLNNSEVTMQQNTSKLVNKGSLGKFIKELLGYLESRKTNLVNRRKLYKVISLPLPIHYMWYLLNNIKVIINDIPFLSKKYDVKYNSDGEVRCFYNAMTISLHFFLLHGRSHLSLKERLLVFALSAIHPAQDDLIDGMGYSKDDANIITNTLKGQKGLTAPLSIRPIINLIEIVYKYFNPNTHPVFVDICLALHKWQSISSKQRDKTIQLSDTELLKISFMKGGYAFALYGYVIQGGMTMSQFRHFFAMGAIFQIMDDLHDVDDDIESNIETVFTRRINNNDVIDSEIYGFLAVQKCFETNIPESIDFEYPMLVRLMELLAARYDILRFYCMNRSRVSKEFNDRILDQFPFDIDDLVNFFSGTREHETLRNYKTVLTEIENRVNEIFINTKI